MWLRKRMLLAALMVVSCHVARSVEAQPYRPDAPAAQPAGQTPPAPFTLTVDEQNTLDLVLRAWQQKSGDIKRFSCGFTRMDYNVVFAAPGAKPGEANKVYKGEIKYSQPDKGLFWIQDAWDPQTKAFAKIPDGDHWVCDGKAIFQFDHLKKELHEYRLPPQLQGKAISDGPLPFVFGVDAEKMKQRYWLKVITPKDAQGQIWLEAWPKWRQDAANFRVVQIILTNDNLLPMALQIYEPNGQDRKVYQFENAKANNALDLVRDFFNSFVAPQTPFGWKRIVDEPPLPVAGPQMPLQPGAPGQAQRPLLPAQR